MNYLMNDYISEENYWIVGAIVVGILALLVLALYYYNRATPVSNQGTYYLLLVAAVIVPTLIIGVIAWDYAISTTLPIIGCIAVDAIVVSVLVYAINHYHK